MLKHCYLPPTMLDSVIIPLVKNKCGDLSDNNNYRPIAISCIISKVFESIILHRIEDYLWTTDNQFGFKAHHSTDLCVYALTEFIEYFKSRSTSVYVAFLDAKSEKSILGFSLKKIIDRQMPLYLVKILCYWYRNQSMYVRLSLVYLLPFTCIPLFVSGGIHFCIYPIVISAIVVITIRCFKSVSVCDTCALFYHIFYFV